MPCPISMVFMGGRVWVKHSIHELLHQMLGKGSWVNLGVASQKGPARFSRELNMFTIGGAASALVHVAPRKIKITIPKQYLCWLPVWRPILTKIALCNFQIASLYLALYPRNFKNHAARRVLKVSCNFLLQAYFDTMDGVTSHFVAFPTQLFIIPMQVRETPDELAHRPNRFREWGKDRGPASSRPRSAHHFQTQSIKIAGF